MPGKAVIIGMSPEPSKNFSFYWIPLTDKHIVGSCGYQYGQVERVIQQMSNGSIQPHDMITGIVPLQDAVEKAFKVLSTNAEAHCKILLKM